MKQLLLAAIVTVSFVSMLAGCSDEASAPSEPDASAALSPGVTEAGPILAYEVTIENLTPATGMGASQVLSPPVLATHRPAVRMFRVGRVASSELAQIAEDAVNQPMLDLLGASEHVHAVAQGGGVILPGHSASYRIETAPGFPFLSLATMLVNTNDAFTGLDSFRLPRRGEEHVLAGAWDAGSETNTELVAHIPGPCCGNPLVRVPTDDPIQPHRGIQGVGDLNPAVWGWDGPVARITVRRVED
ncbi:MAG: spondin domain-containing protein [Candidatus Eiseniibacteriota bacterium]